MTWLVMDIYVDIMEYNSQQVINAFLVRNGHSYNKRNGNDENMIYLYRGYSVAVFVCWSVGSCFQQFGSNSMYIHLNVFRCVYIYRNVYTRVFEVKQKQTTHAYLFAIRETTVYHGEAV